MSVIEHDKNDFMHNLMENIQLIVFDFDGVFTDNRVLVIQDGSEGVFCWRGDGLGLSAIKRLGIGVMVISTEVNPVVSVRCEKLGLPCIYGCDNKAKVLQQEAENLHIPLKNIAYMGNDINDLGCLKIVGLPACVADSHPDVLKVASYISKNVGGYGAVREFCDYVVDVKAEKKD